MYCGKIMFKIDFLFGLNLYEDIWLCFWFEFFWDNGKICLVVGLFFKILI